MSIRVFASATQTVHASGLRTHETIDGPSNDGHPRDSADRRALPDPSGQGLSGERTHESRSVAEDRTVPASWSKTSRTGGPNDEPRNVPNIRFRQHRASRIIAVATSVQAHGFATSASPDHYVADSSIHTFISTEGNSAERFWIESIFDDRMVSQYNDRTDLTTIKASSCSTMTDVYWFVTNISSGPGDATCVSYLDAPASPPVCDQVRVRFDPDWASSVSGYEKRQGTCHEIGHSVGFDDSQPEANTGCMSGGSIGHLSSHEVTHLNQEY